MIGHRTRFRENNDLPLWRCPAAKKKPTFFLCFVFCVFFYVGALIMREIMRSKDAQCKTGE